MTRAAIIVAGAALLAAAATGGRSAKADLMIPDNAGNRIMLFDDFDGSLIDANWSAPFVFALPVEAKVVGNEIWVSDYSADAIHRFDLDRRFLGSITDGTSDVWGFGVHGSTVYAVVDGWRWVHMFDFSGTLIGLFEPNHSHFTDNVLDIAPFGEELLVSNSTGDGAIERYSTSGTFLGNFQTGVNWAQVDTLPDGTVIAAAPNIDKGVYHWNADGSLIRFINTDGSLSNPYAAWLLGDGNYLISNRSIPANSPGVYKYIVATNSFELIIGNVEPMFINPIDLPAPCPADTDGSGTVDVDDLIATILQWGRCEPPPALCSADVNDSGAVDVDDLIAVILAWGPCE